MNKRIWIGLTGFKQSGKDTFGKVLAEEFGFVRIAFADKLRELVYAINPMVVVPRKFVLDLGYEFIPHEVVVHYTVSDGYVIRLQSLVDWVGWDAAKQLDEVRGLLQRTGKEGVRDVLGERTWIDAAMREAEKFERVYFSDVRFPNENTSIRNVGGCSVRINRATCQTDDPHESEVHIPNLDVDCDVYNNGTIAELHGSARQLMEIMQSELRDDVLTGEVK